MSAPPYMQLYVADYLGDTRHLTTEQHGAYLLLLMAMWRAGGRLPNEGAKLARIVGLTAARWAKLEGDVLSFFDVADGELIHARVEKELEKYTRTATKRKAAGAKGGAAKSLKNIGSELASANILLEQNDSNCGHISEPEPDKRVKASLSAAPVGATVVAINSTRPDAAKRAKPWLTDPAFCAVWDAATPEMRRRSLSREATYAHFRRQAVRAGGTGVLGEAMATYLSNDPDVKRTGGPGLHLWLRDGTWEHWLNDASAFVTTFDVAKRRAENRRLYEEQPE